MSDKMEFTTLVLVLETFLADSMEWDNEMFSSNEYI